MFPFLTLTSLVALLLVHAGPATAQSLPAGVPAQPNTPPTTPLATTPPAARSPITAPSQTRTNAPAPRPQPEDAKAPVPPVQHRSALPGVSTSAAVPVDSWLNANRVVDEVGGWRAYLKEAHGLSAQPEKGK